MVGQIPGRDFLDRAASGGRVSLQPCDLVWIEITSIVAAIGPLRLYGGGSRIAPHAGELTGGTDHAVSPSRSHAAEPHPVA
jgi:hypothetical protein